MGWGMLAAVMLVSAAVLWRLGLPRLLWTTAGTALLLGGAGYAMQGRPMLGASPAKPVEDKVDIAPDILALRGKMFSSYTSDSAYQMAADAMIRVGDPGKAVKVTLGGIDRNPRSVQLWTELGSVLVTHDGGSVSPSALFAFRHAMQLSPQHPGPPFFLGLGYAQGGQLQQARFWWARALALTPKTLSYRADIAERLALLDQVIAMARQQQQAQQ